jgi:hypothetical protein
VVEKKREKKKKGRDWTTRESSKGRSVKKDTENQTNKKKQKKESL